MPNLRISLKWCASLWCPRTPDCIWQISPVLSTTTWVWITWKCLCPEKYNSWGSMCGLLISVDVPSIAPTADGNLFQLPIFEVHSSSEGHWTNAWKCSLIIGIHQLISSCTVVTLTSKSKERRWYDGYERIHSMNNITRCIGDNLCGRPVAWNMSLLSCRTISSNVSGVSPVVSKNEYLLKENIWNISLPSQEWKSSFTILYRRSNSWSGGGRAITKTTCVSILRKLTSSGGTRISAGKALRTTLLLSSAIVSCKIQKYWSSLT